MAYFPRLDASNRAPRVRPAESVSVSVRTERHKPLPAELMELSATGCLRALGKPLRQGDLVELAFQTKNSSVSGMAEVLQPTEKAASGCLQAFRFVALDDEDHSKLRTLLRAGRSSFRSLLMASHFVTFRMRFAIPELAISALAIQSE